MKIQSRFKGTQDRKKVNEIRENKRKSAVRADDDELDGLNLRKNY